MRSASVAVLLDRFVWFLGYEGFFDPNPAISCAFQRVGVVGSTDIHRFAGR